MSYFLCIVVRWSSNINNKHICDTVWPTLKCTTCSKLKSHSPPVFTNIWWYLLESWFQTVNPWVLCADANFIHSRKLKPPLQVVLYLLAFFLSFFFAPSFPLSLPPSFLQQKKTSVIFLKGRDLLVTFKRSEHIFLVCLL